MIPLFKVNMASTAAEQVAKVLHSGMIGEGPKVEEFRNKLRKLFGSQYVTCTNSCTSALSLALHLAVRPGSKVLSTPFTFWATNSVIIQRGAKIVWGEIESETLCLDVDKAIKSLSETEIAAVVITLVGGTPPLNLEKLYKYLQRQGIPLILDCAHALMTTYQDKHISSWCDYAAFSFQAIKHLTTGDGGALVCQTEEDFSFAEQLKWFGVSREVPEGMTRLEHQMSSWPTIWGYKAHMNDISAAIGLANYELAQWAVQRSRSNAQFFDAEIPQISSGLSLLKNPEADSSYWVYGFRYNDSRSSLDIAKAFERKGITASPLWPYPPRQKNLQVIFIPNGFWVTDLLREKILDAVRVIFGD